MSAAPSPMHARPAIRSIAINPNPSSAAPLKRVDELTLFRSWFEWVNEFPSSIAFRESYYVYPAFLTSHVIAVCLFAGLVMMMDLRLLGIGNTRTPLSQVQRRLFPWQMATMAISLATGLMLFYGQPMRFYGNIFFWVKMVMIALTGVNAMAFHQITYRTVAEWDHDVSPPLGSKLSGALSLMLWAGVIIAGRLIAYNWFS
jgi:hypothetical protein